MSYRIFLILVFVSIPFIDHTVVADQYPQTIKKDCSYGSLHLTCYKAIAPFNKLGINEDGDFVITKDKSDFKYPIANMDLEMPQSAIDYFVKYGFPEYANDVRLQRAQLIKIWINWIVDEDSGMSKYEQNPYSLEVKDQTGKTRLYHPSLWRVKKNYQK